MARPSTLPAPAFDAYLVVDWSAAGRPRTGEDSVWWALLTRGVRGPELRTGNPATRAELVAWARAQLAGPLAGARVLAGFDFPLGYPRGLAAALGHRGPAREAWRATWERLASEVRDGDDNANDRFAAAARLNRALTGAYGPFFGRPARVADVVAGSLSPRQRGAFAWPVATLRGPALARMRPADLRARAASSPWFVYGGGNSVGGQALTGIPRLRSLRDAVPGARAWPFETGARLPAPRDAPVVLAEVYPTQFHRRDPGSPEVHDALQVQAAARRFAALDDAGELAGLFAAPPHEPEVLGEEGWVLGVR